MENETPLKPCPYCLEAEDLTIWGEGRVYWIYCGCCLSHGPHIQRDRMAGTIAEAEERAKAAWNERP